MALSMDDVIEILNDLTETCRDGEEGFRMAAECVKDSELRSMFEAYSSQRGGFVRDLQHEVKLIGGDPEKNGSVAGSLHRGWINIKSTVTRDAQAVIDECENGEDAAVKSYRDALAKDLPADILAIVQNQFEQIKEVHDRISTLKHSGGHTEEPRDAHFG